MLLCALAACGRGGALVRVVNESPDTLRSVVLSGRGFTDTLAKLSPKSVAAVRVRPRGESGIGLTFTAGNRHISVPEQGYFEPAGGYVVLVTVDSALVTKVQVTLEGY